MLITYLEADPTKAAKEVLDIRGACARFKLLENIYKDHLQQAKDTEDDDNHVDYHQTCSLRCYLLFLVDIHIYGQKCNIHRCGHLKYFIDLMEIHK